MRILRESPVPADSKWFEENMNDFSLSSFLGHLEANCDQSNSRRSRSPRCVSISVCAMCIISFIYKLKNILKNEI